MSRAAAFCLVVVAAGLSPAAVACPCEPLTETCVFAGADDRLAIEQPQAWQCVPSAPEDIAVAPRRDRIAPEDGAAPAAHDPWTCVHAGDGGLELDGEPLNWACVDERGDIIVERTDETVLFLDSPQLHFEEFAAFYYYEQ